jgi:alpha-galactosidase
MKHLGDHMHSLGVSFGIYSDEGTRTCGGFQGSEGHEAKDAKTFADWGVE